MVKYGRKPDWQIDYKIKTLNEKNRKTSLDSGRARKTLNNKIISGRYEIPARSRGRYKQFIRKRKYKKIVEYETSSAVKGRWGKIYAEYYFYKFTHGTTRIRKRVYSTGYSKKHMFPKDRQIALNEAFYNAFAKLMFSPDDWELISYSYLYYEAL